MQFVQVTCIIFSMKFLRPEQLTPNEKHSVRWHPNTRRGGDDVVHKLLTVRGNLISIGYEMIIKYFSLAIAGITLLVIIIFNHHLSGMGDFNGLKGSGLLFTMYMLLPFICFLNYWLRKLTPALTIDRYSGVYYHGKKFAPEADSDRKHQGYLEDLKGLQIITKKVIRKGDDGYTYTRFANELNMVCIDGYRITIMCSSNRRLIKKSARKLSILLDLPVWANELWFEKGGN